MNLEPAPRLNKVPFIAATVVCLTVVVLTGLFAQNKFAPLPYLTAVCFLILGIAVFMIPFLIDYTANAAEYVQQERVRADEQVQRLLAAGESLARAAAQIKAVEEAVHKTAHAAETLPYRMQEKLAEFNAALAQKEENDQESLEAELAELRAANSDQLKAIAEKIHKAAAEWSTLEAATRKQLAAAEATAAKIQQSASDTATKFEARLTAALATLDASLVRLDSPRPSAQTVIPSPAAEPVLASVAEAKSTPTTEPFPLVESVAIVDASGGTEVSSGMEEAKIRKPKAPRKTKAEDTLVAMSGLGTDRGNSESTPEETALVEDQSEIIPMRTTTESFRPDSAESAASSDGATRLLATAYIGIGNKLFIRGEGPGLSLTKGVPMQFVSIGKWGWATNDAISPVRCELYKNDETAALTGEVILDPGKHVEITALF